MRTRKEPKKYKKAATQIFYKIDRGDYNEYRVQLFNTVDDKAISHLCSEYGIKEDQIYYTEKLYDYWFSGKISDINNSKLKFK